MYCILDNHRYEYDLQTITQVFFPNEGFLITDEIRLEGLTLRSALEGSDCISEVYLDGVLKCRVICRAEHDDDQKRILIISMYRACVMYTGYKPPWGAMTGIRPSKLVRMLADQGMDKSEIRTYLHNRFLTPQDKIELAISVEEAERRIVDSRYNDGVSLYINIPFCMSRCLYCSFTAYPLAKHHGLKDAYFEALFKELEAVMRIIAGRPVESIYIGGGTPTSVDARDLENLLGFVRKNVIELNPRSVKEFCVEAGRPDTMDAQKLGLLKDYGVTRISVNPQTMNDRTLERIGRHHTAQGFTEAFMLARELGHDNINCDVIMGLPGEGLSDAEHTMNALKPLAPENITVHTLAVKKASQLKEGLATMQEMTAAKTVQQMLGICAESCTEMGMHPYYMYRQKNMLGNLENVAYCREGKGSVYNVLIMEEVQDIYAVGTGAITKLMFENNRIERVFNVKNLEEYIKRIDEMIERKMKHGSKGIFSPEGNE